MNEKPSRNEDEFFAREEAEKLYRLHAEKLKAHNQAAIDAEKKAHWMKCGKCGYDLQPIHWHGIELDKCFRCEAVLLDAGELEKVAAHKDAGRFVSSFIGLFKK